MAKTPKKESAHGERPLLVAPGIPGVVLSDVAKVLRAPLLKNETTRGGDAYRVASISDMNDFGYLPTPEKEIRLRQGVAKAEKYRLEPHDVLLTIVGTIGKISIVPAEFAEKWIPTSNMLIIRFLEDKAENAVAFTMFIKSMHGRSLLAKLTHGKTIPIISKKAFAKTVLPALTATVRKESKSVFSREEKLYQKRDELLDQAEELRKSYLVSGSGR